MPSAVDPTRPEDGKPASKADLRVNLATAKAELEHGGFAEGHLPTNYSAATSRVSDHLAGIDAALGASGSASAFTGLADTPASYAGQANRYTRVKSDETGLEFVAQAAGGDASNTSYTPAGAGAVTRTAQAKLREVVSVKDFGAVGNGTTDDSNAFILARQHAEALRRNAQVNDGNLDIRGTVAIYVPPGAYLITQKGAMCSGSFTSKTYGLTWFGAPGTYITEIIYRPGTLDGATPNTPFMTNDAWLGIRCYNLRFTCDTPGAWFMHSIANSAEQDYYFHDCVWDGAWGGGFYLTGTDNNSEYKFFTPYIRHFDRGPFLWANQSDQFLNYWFYGVQYNDSHAPLIRMTTGGHVHIYGMDASNYAYNPGAFGFSQCYLFELLGTSHSQGVCNFTAHNVRVESKNAAGGLLKSEWSYGTVLFDAVDYSSQARWNIASYGAATIDVNFVDDGVGYTFRDSQMAGGITVRASSVAHTRYKPHIKFENCRWWDRAKPSDVVTYVVPSGAGGRPIVQFRNCMSFWYDHSLDQRAVWDADIGSRNARFVQGEEKVFTVRGWDTTVVNTFSQRLKFPIGTIITKFSAVGRPGGSAETTTATYSLKSTEGTPTTIAQVSASNPSTARAYAETPTNLPWFCDTVQTADLDILAEANVGLNHNDLMFIIRYL